LNKAKQEAAELAVQFKNTENPTKAQARAMEAAKKSAADLQLKYNGLRQSVQRQRTELAQAGINTRTLSADERRLKTSISETTAQLNRQREALALYRLPEPVIFELQVSGGFFCRLHRARLRFGGVFRVFKLDGKLCGLLFRFIKRLTGHGKLCARFPESVDSGRLRVKVAQGRL
ncbi:hypothetical protein VE13_24090, partial [Enterobacter hormaechei]